MPTRTGTKPATYTFSAATAPWDDLLAGHIYSDEAAGSSPDITGGGNDIDLQGTASITATDATHGDCLDTGDSGADLVPPGAWDSLGAQTLIYGLRVDVDSKTINENIGSLEHSASGRDSMRVIWTSGEDVSGTVEDTGSNSASTSVTNGIENNSGEWLTAAVCFDGTAATLDVYVIIDGETTQESHLTSISPTALAANNTYKAGQGVTGGVWPGLVEYNYIFDSSLSKTQIEAIHVDPYSWDTAGGGSVGSSAGTSQALAIGQSSFEATASSDGTSEALGTGRAILQSVASSDGASEALGIGQSTAEALGSSDGASEALGIGQGTVDAVASSDGTSEALGTGQSTAESTGSSAGLSEALGIGQSTAESIASSDGTSEALGVGQSVSAGQGVGASDGTSEVLGIGQSTHVAVASSDGTSEALGVAVIASQGVGFSFGTSQAAGIGRSLVTISGVGSSVGTSSALFVGRDGATTWTIQTDNVSNWTEKPNESTVWAEM